MRGRGRGEEGREKKRGGGRQARSKIQESISLDNNQKDVASDWENGSFLPRHQHHRQTMSHTRSGQVPLKDGKMMFVVRRPPLSSSCSVLAGMQGKCGKDFSVEEGYECAKLCAVNVISQARES
eukprot:432017-Hanusia_phi.AAC.1